MLFAFLQIGFAGVLLVLRPDMADQNAFYVGLGLLSGALSSGSSISLRLLGLKGEPPIRTLFWFALACTVSGAAATLMFSKGLQAEHVFSIPVLLMGVFTALGQWTQNIGWKKGKTLLCASLQFSAVIFAVIFGYLSGRIHVLRYFDYCCRFLRRYDLQIEVLQRRLSPKLAAVRNTKGLRINVGTLQKSITLPLRNFVRPATND